MNTLKRLWIRIAQLAEALEGMDDPTGEYMFSLGKRVEKLERDLDHLKRHLDSRPSDDTVPDHAGGN